MTRLSQRQARQLGILPGKKKRDIPKIARRPVQWDAKTFPGGIWLQLPEVPPSLNVWKNWHWGKQHRYKQDLYQSVRTLALAAKLPQYERAVVQIRYCFRDGRLRDKDNYNGKFLLDAIRYAGIIPDDNSDVVDLPEPVFEVDRQRPRVEVFIWERKWRND